MRKILVTALTLSLVWLPESAQAAPKLTDKELIKIMGTCFNKYKKRINSGESLFTPGYMDTTMALLSDCVESKSNYRAVCGKSTLGDTICGIKGSRVGRGFF